MNKRSRNVVLRGLLLAALVAKAWAARAGADEANPAATADNQLIGEIRDHSELMANLEYLSDRIGPRMTGTPLLKQANEWTAEMFRKYGLSDVHLESYTIAHAWTRGAAKGRIIAFTEEKASLASGARRTFAA